VKSPLAGKRVLVPRALEQGAGVADLLRDRGAEALIIPSIVLGPPDDEVALAEALAPARLAGTDWVVFTSANGVAHTWRALGAPKGANALPGARVAVVGPVTLAALVEHGGEAELVATESRGEGLARQLLPKLTATDGRAPRVLILRAEEASPALPEALLAAGVRVDVVAAYRTRPSIEGAREIARRLVAGEIDVVVFSSGSTVAAVCDALGTGAREELEKVTVACIGPVTAADASARGLRVDVVPASPTFLAVVRALEIHFRDL
jgi:uroporphyrinogen III methyltransferase/synthase